MTKGITLSVLASFGLLGCTGDLEDTTPEDLPPEGSTSGSEDSTFDHDNDGYSPWDLIDRLAKEGPPRYTSRVHSCAKVRYATLSNVMRSLGINVDATANLSAGQLYRTGGNAMGAPSYGARVRENIDVTTSGSSRLFDIFAAASQEIQTAMPTLQRCMTNGSPAVLFNPDNSCRADGITCLIGVPAQAAHLDFCNLTVTSASTPEIGKRVAVAALLAAAYTCE